MFCGAGGASLGAEAAGAEIAAGIDHWEAAVTAFADLHPGATVYGDDIESFDTYRVVAGDGPIDILLASPPCTGFSQAAGAKLNTAPNRLTLEVVRFARDLEPRYIVVENVIQFRHSDEYRRMDLELGELGYWRRMVGMEASRYGNPSRRLRVFVLYALHEFPWEPDPPSGRGLVAKDLLIDLPMKPLRERGPSTRKRCEVALKELGPGIPFIVACYNNWRPWSTLDKPLFTVVAQDRLAYCDGQGNIRMLSTEELARAMQFPRVPKAANRRQRIRLIGNAVAPAVMKAIIHPLVRKHTPSHA